MEKIPLHINNHLNPGIIESANTVRKKYYSHIKEIDIIFLRNKVFYFQLVYH